MEHGSEPAKASNKTPLAAVVKILKLVFKVLAFVAVFITVIDALLRLRLEPRVRVEFEESTGPETRTLIVYLPGILASARGSAGDLLDDWREYGDVLLVEYGDDRFVADKVVEATVAAITSRLQEKTYTQIVFLGSSMGGMLVYDVTMRLGVALDLIDDPFSLPQIDLVVLDAPTSARDFVSPNDKLAGVFQVLYPGPIMNQLNLVAEMFVPPKEDNVEPGVDREELVRRVSEGSSFRFSFYADEVRYLMNHGPLSPGLDGLVHSVTYVQCVRDNVTIRPEASDAWFWAFMDTRVVQVDSTHVGFAERPHTWEIAFRDILGSVVHE